MIEFETWPVRLVTTAELAAAECSPAYTLTVEAMNDPEVRLRGVDFRTERVIQLLPGESPYTAHIHAAMIAEAFGKSRTFRRALGIR